jgi:hypothetical protein
MPIRLITSSTVLDRAPEAYKYLSFDKMALYIESAKQGQEIVMQLVA